MPTPRYSSGLDEALGDFARTVRRQSGLAGKLMEIVRHEKALVHSCHDKPNLAPRGEPTSLHRQLDQQTSISADSGNDNGRDDLGHQVVDPAVEDGERIHGLTLRFED
jgi:hypothetical protein